MARASKQDPQEIVAFYFVTVYIDEHGKEYYSQRRWRPYTKIAPARALQNSHRSRAARYLLSGVPQHFTPHGGRLMVAPDGVTVWENYASNPSYYKGNPTALTYVDREDYRILRLDKNGITEV